MMANMILDQFESRGFSVGDRFVKRVGDDVDAFEIVGVDYLIAQYSRARNGVLVTDSRWVSAAKLLDMLYCGSYDAVTVESVDSDWTPEEAAAAVDMMTKQDLRARLDDMNDRCMNGMAYRQFAHELSAINGVVVKVKRHDVGLRLNCGAIVVSSDNPEDVWAVRRDLYLLGWRYQTTTRSGGQIFLSDRCWS